MIVSRYSQKTSSHLDRNFNRYDHIKKKQKKGKQLNCSIPVQFMVFVSIYMIGSLIYILKSASTLARETARYRKPVMISYHQDWHPKTRLQRFPSVEKRVEMYMMKWYHLCPSEIAPSLQYHIPSVNQSCWRKRKQATMIRVGQSLLGSDFKFEYGIRQGDFPLYLDETLLTDCTRGLFSTLFDKIRLFQSSEAYTIHNRSKCRSICEDLLELTSELTEAKAPVLATLGNSSNLYKDQNTKLLSTIPIFAPWRQIFVQDMERKNNHQGCSVSGEGLSATPIIWPMNMIQQRTLVRRASERDTSWDMKRPTAVWRCLFSSPSCNYAQLQTKKACLENDPICRFIYDHANSELVDAGYGIKFPLTEKEMDGRAMSKNQFGFQSLQAYKILLHFEGNMQDYGASLAWKLYSKSVVLMPPPMHSTWLMEELLEPWVHYIPLNNTKSSAEQMVRWVIDHDEMAQRIAERASLFIYDLILHQDATEDDENVRQKIIQRYKSHWIGLSDKNTSSL